MTREEMEELKGLAASMGLYDDKNPSKRAVVLGKAIRALEQEPCNDCISRQAVLDMICNVDGMEGFENSNIFAKHYVNNVKALPPVTPQPKTGHWIEIAKYSDGMHEIECSECGNHIFDRGHANSLNVKNKYKYCPKCGAEMKEGEK